MSNRAVNMSTTYGAPANQSEDFNDHGTKPAAAANAWGTIPKTASPSSGTSLADVMSEQLAAHLGSSPQKSDHSGITIIILKFCSVQKPFDYYSPLSVLQFLPSLSLLLLIKTSRYHPKLPNRKKVIEQLLRFD